MVNKESERELTKEERAVLLRQLRTEMRFARDDFKALGFGYAVLDAVSELREFLEFELDELGEDYD